MGEETVEPIQFHTTEPVAQIPPASQPRHFKVTLSAVLKSKIQCKQTFLQSSRGLKVLVEAGGEKAILSCFIRKATVITI